MDIEFKRLSEVDKSDIVALMNNPLVRRQMPLTSDNFNETDCDEFIAAKERLSAGRAPKRPMTNHARRLSSWQPCQF